MAARFRAALDARSEQSRLEEERKRETQARLERERTQLMADLKAFGEAIGHFQIRSRRDHLEFSFEGRSLKFIPQENGTITIESQVLTGTHSLVFENTLQKWVWCHKPRLGRMQQRMLFDSGLETLLGVAFTIRAGAAQTEPETSAVLDERERKKRTL